MANDNKKKEQTLTASQRISEADAEALKTQTQTDKDSEETAGEDALEQHYMGFFEKIRYQYRQYKEKTQNMTPTEHLKYFLYYYKWTVIGIAMAIILGFTLARQLYINSRPMAIGIAIINNEADREQQLAAQIEADYRSYYTFKGSDRFVILENLEIDPENYTQEISATSTNTLSSYENLYYQITGDNIDVIITDEAGILYCVEQDLVYPIENFLSEEARTLYEDDVCIYTSYTNQKREYAIDISDTAFAASLNLGYDKIYLLFPSDEEDNKQRAEQFIRYIYNPS